MAFVFIYLLPVFLLCVLIPKTNTSAISDVGQKQRSDIVTTDDSEASPVNTAETSEELERLVEENANIRETPEKQAHRENHRRRQGHDEFDEKQSDVTEAEVVDDEDKSNKDDEDKPEVITPENTDEKTKDETKQTSTAENKNENAKEEAKQVNTVANNNENTNDEATKACPKCGDEEKLKDLRIEMVKYQLLQKLGMSSAPKVDGPIHPLPFDFYVGNDLKVNDGADNDEDADINEVRTRQVFVMGKDITDQCVQKKSTGCYSFNITGKNINPDDVTGIELWIYKQADHHDHHIQTFMVSELSKYQRHGKEVLRVRNIVKRIETRLKYGWMKIYVMRAVLRWLSKPHRNKGLAVVCKTCQRTNHRTIYGDKEGLTPILVFYINKNRHSKRRYKRETNCIEGGNNCCHKEALEINFRDIGWDYIMAPTSIRPNYCTGSCNGIQAAHYNHTRVIQTLQQSVIHNIGVVQPCCSPVAFRRPQSLLYRDHEGTIRKIDVPDLIVGECGCT